MFLVARLWPEALEPRVLLVLVLFAHGIAVLLQRLLLVGPCWRVAEYRGLACYWVLLTALVLAFLFLGLRPHPAIGLLSALFFTTLTSAAAVPAIALTRALRSTWRRHGTDAGHVSR